MGEIVLANTSIADIPEDQLVDRILADPMWGSEFFQFAGMPSGMENRHAYLGGRTRQAQRGYRCPLLRAEPPGQAVAYQVKRIKFGFTQLRNGTPGKLEEFKKLVRQANLLARMGFWQVYAAVIVVVDAREQNAGTATYQGLPSKMRSVISSAISTEFLDERVGLSVLEFTQPMDSVPLTNGAHGLDVRRFAKSANRKAKN